MFRQPLFKKQFDMNALLKRVHKFTCDHQGQLPTVLFCNREDYNMIRESLRCDTFKYAFNDAGDFARMAKIACPEPFDVQMKIQNIKIVHNEHCKEPVLAIVEGM